MDEKKETQALKAIQYMTEHGFIDNEHAFEALRITRLGAVIWYIRNKLNVVVHDEWQFKYDDKGKVISRWKRYWL